MKWIGFLVLFFFFVFALYYVLFSIPSAVKRTKEATQKNPHRSFVIALFLVGFLISVILYFAEA